MWAKLLIFLLLPLLPAYSFGTQVTYLHPDEPHIQDVQMLQTLYPHNSFHVFCKEATPLSMWTVFQSSRLHLQICDCVDYKQYKAYSMNELQLAYNQGTEDFEGKPLGLRTHKDRIISLSVHDEVYYGICTNSKFVLTLKVIPCDMERITQFIFGLALWASCPLLEDSMRMASCSAGALGAHLAAVLVVFLAVLSSGEKPSIARLCPLKANFKQVYEERPNLVILVMLIVSRTFQVGFEKVSFLWRYRIIRKLHCRLLRTVAYLLISHASDHRTFGWVCVFLLICWPELWKLHRFLKSHYNRNSNPMSELCEERSELWEERPRRMHTSQYFARNPNDNNPVGILRNANKDMYGARENSSRIRKHHARLRRQGCEDQTHPSTKTAAAHDKIFHPSRRSTPK